MGKGEIVSDLGDGLYSVRVLYNRDKYNEMISALNTKKAALNDELEAATEDKTDQERKLNSKVSAANDIADVLVDLYFVYKSANEDLVFYTDELIQLEIDLINLQESGADPSLIEIKQAQIAAKNAQISETQTEINETKSSIDENYNEYVGLATEAQELNIELQVYLATINDIKLHITAIEKRIEYLGDNMPEDSTVTAWCADLTEDLSGNVGTIEVPGERGILQIQPGYEDNATYDQVRDGQLFPTLTMTPAQAFYNLAMMPGWQKWNPCFRHGIISDIDTENDTASVVIESVNSSQQGLGINQAGSIVDVPIEYMFCNAAAFEDGDNVLVMFSDNKFSNPKIIGFKDNPKPCGPFPAFVAYNSDGEEIGRVACISGKWGPPYQFAGPGQYEDLEDQGVYANRANVETEDNENQTCSYSGAVLNTQTYRDTLVQVSWFLNYGITYTKTYDYTLKVGNDRVALKTREITRSGSYTALGNSVTVDSPDGGAIDTYVADYKSDMDSWTPNSDDYKLSEPMVSQLYHKHPMQGLVFNFLLNWDMTHNTNGESFSSFHTFSSSFSTPDKNDGGLMWVEVENISEVYDDDHGYNTAEDLFPYGEQHPGTLTEIDDTADIVLKARAWGEEYELQTMKDQTASGSSSTPPGFFTWYAKTYKYGYNEETEEEDKNKVFLGSVFVEYSDENKTCDYVRMGGGVTQYAEDDRGVYEVDPSTLLHPIDDFKATIGGVEVQCYGWGDVSMINFATEAEA